MPFKLTNNDLEEVCDVHIKSLGQVYPKDGGLR
jgi:hypothetical protein